MMTAKVKSIAKNICEKIKSAPIVDINAITRKDYNGNDFKNGLYFVYDKKDVVIYVGKISNAKNTSLYMRFVGHGAGAHKNDAWYKTAKKVQFMQFAAMDNEMLELAERLVILFKRPSRNDADTSEERVLRLLDGKCNV
jgi:hypothetical protein